MAEKVFQLSDFFLSLFGMSSVREEKARLEAFLAAVPGEYCGWAQDGSVAYSMGFCEALDIDAITTIHDIQAALKTSDAAALEGMYCALEDSYKEFSFTAHSRNEKKTFRISGSKGRAIDGRDHFNVLWLEDITKMHGEQLRLQKAFDLHDQEINKLQSLLDTVPVPLWMRSEDGKELIWCNKAYAEIVEISPAEVIAEQKELPITTKHDVKDALVPGPEMAKKALDSGTAQEASAHVIFQGSRHLIHVVELPLSSSHRTLGFANDITREEELETQLNRYVAANKELLEQLNTAIAIYGPDHALEFYNAAFAQLWGLEDQWLNGKPKLGDILEKLREIRRLPEEADFKGFKDSWINMFTRLIDPHEDMLYLPDGTALRYLVIPHPMGGLMMTFENVTSRLELESSYNTLIAVQKETLDNLAEAVAVYGGDGRLKLCNPSFVQLWKLNPEDVEGEPHVKTLTEKMSSFYDQNCWEETKKTLISQGISRRIQEGRLERKDETLIDYATVPLPDGGVLISYFDVTDSTKVEKALREKNAALETAERLKLDFLANVSYQLRTPLNAIMGFAEILDHQFFGDLNDKQKEYTSGIQEAGDRLVHLIDDILDLSTIEAGYLDLRFQEFDVYKMLQGLSTLTEDWARKQNLQVTLECPESIGPLKADERRIKQALLNLIRNAIDNTPEGGKIILRADKQDNAITLEVQDTGVGIAKDIQDKIFDPFERAEDKAHQRSEIQSTQERGAGLGLSLVKNIVELHSGTITLSSEEDKGTIIRITIPLSSSKEESKSTAQEAA